MSTRLRDRWPDMNPAARGARMAGVVLLGIIGAGIFALVFGWLVMILWNWLMPAIFHLGTIGYWQAFGIIILAKLIFGASHGGRGHGPRHKPWGHGPFPHGEGQGKDRWMWYREFWEQEGRQAFDKFVQQKTGGQTAGDEQKTPGA
jgi:hypothetical protein